MGGRVKLLEGFSALDLTTLMGQLCGRFLADLGMEVVKVEPPGGDPVRRLGPFRHDEPHLEGSLRFAHLNAGKKSLTLDITRSAGRDLLLRLVEKVDVLVESFPPGELARVGLGTEELRRRNPRLLVTSVSGFGQTGPHRDYHCPDIVGFAMGGLMHISGDPGLPPVKAPETQAYYFTSHWAALATLLGVWQRERDGSGRSADIAVQEALASQEHLIRTFSTDKRSIKRHGSQHQHTAPANIFPTKDGYVYLFVSGPRHWGKLLELWDDHPSEFDNPEWAQNHVRREHAERLNAALSEYTRRFTKEELVQMMQQHGLPTLPVNTPREFQEDPHVRWRGLFQPAQHVVLGDYLQPSFPMLLDGQRNAALPPPLLGEHTHEVLTSRLGLLPSDIEQLFAHGVI